MEIKKYGMNNWFFPDAELPPPGDGQMKGHESIIILNPNQQKATLTIICYFEYPEKPFKFSACVEPESVRCLRTNNPDDMGGHIIPEEIQYAISLHSDEPIIAQYGRLDNRQVNLAFYTTPGYYES